MHPSFDIPNTREGILAALDAWQAKQEPITPMSDERAMEKLTLKKLTPEDIGEKMAKIRMNGGKAPLRYIASYPDLQAIDRLQEANQGMDLSDNDDAANIRALMQCSEICLLNIHDLAPKIASQFAQQEMEKYHHYGVVGLDGPERLFGETTATEAYRWISSFQETLGEIVGLLERLPANGKGVDLSLSNSPHIGQCFDSLKVLHKELGKQQRFQPMMIKFNGTDINHQNFVDTIYTEMWEKALKQVHIPGVERATGQKKHDLYQQFVGTEALNLAVNELDQIDPPFNFLRQFRAYHQISEILTARVNELFCKSIRELADPTVPTLQAKEHLNHAVQMLDIVNRNLQPIARNLSFMEYHNIRDSLGVTSGSDSPNLRAGLFHPLYGLLVAAAEQRALGFTPCSEKEKEKRLSDIVAHRNENNEYNNLYEIMEKTLSVHTCVNRWRNAHLQLIKTQIGVGEDEETQTGSIKGSKNAYLTAKGFFEFASKTDPIPPIFKAIRGKKYVPEPIETQSENLPYNRVMADATAKTVKIYDKVEFRVNGDLGGYSAILGPNGELVKSTLNR
jgi:tryptophan 2,3-dioxygenase